MSVKAAREAWRRSLKRMLKDPDIIRAFGPKFVGSKARLVAYKPHTATVNVMDHSYDFKFDYMVIDLVSFSAMFFCKGREVGSTDLMGLDLIELVDDNLNLYLEWDCINIE